VILVVVKMLALAVMVVPCGNGFGCTSEFDASK
jgi:hypothetical protein